MTKRSSARSSRKPRGTVERVNWKSYGTDAPLCSRWSAPPLRKCSPGAVTCKRSPVDRGINVCAEKDSPSAHKAAPAASTGAHLGLSAILKTHTCDKHRFYAIVAEGKCNGEQHAFELETRPGGISGDGRGAGVPDRACIVEYAQTAVAITERAVNHAIAA